MFVKIDRDGHQCLYECNSALIHPMKDDNSKFDLVLEKRHYEDTIVIQIDKTQQVRIYFMNNDGKTIDTFRYPQDTRF